MDAFEVGEAEHFEEWLASGRIAWFHLDSVDEARLSDPRRFETAMRRFERRIRKAKDRTRVVISSRPYAWRFKDDAQLVTELFAGDASEHDEQQSGFGLLLLDPLNADEVRSFAAHRDTPETPG